MRGQRLRPTADDGLAFDNYRIGQTVHSAEFKLTTDVASRFLEATGLSNPLYVDDGHSQDLGHRERIVPEFLVLSIAQALLEEPGILGDAVVALSGIDDLAFVKPVYVGDVLRVEVRVEGIRLAGESESRRGQVALRVAVLANSSTLVARGVVRALVASKAAVTTV